MKCPACNSEAIIREVGIFKGKSYKEAQGGYCESCKTLFLDEEEK
jgi:transposase-like protein